MSRGKGQNLVEFSIIIALVAIVCIAILSLLGVNINSLFNTSYNKVDNFKPFGVGYDKDTGARAYKAGELGGTSSVPKSVCQSGSCAVDYGDFILTGIPENYGDFIETAGNSGGTSELAELLKQIGEQVNDTDTSDGNSAEDFKLIAKLGHFSASIQKAGEKAAAECSSAGDPKACFSAKDSNFKPTDIALPDDLASILTRWPTPTRPTSYSFDTFSQILGKIDLGWAKSGFASYPDLYPSIQIMKAYDRIKAADASDGVTPQMKQIATEMIKQIDSLNDNLKNTYFKFNNSSGQWSNYDPITGTRTWNTGIGTGNISEIFHPQTGKGTDIRSNIFCATGGFKPDGTKCK